MNVNLIIYEMNTYTASRHDWANKHEHVNGSIVKQIKRVRMTSVYYLIDPC